MRFTTGAGTINLLPEDLLIEILAKVAASSLTNLFNAKLVTKNFLKASENGYIFRHASLKNFSNLLWGNNDKFWSFMENCNKNGNSEALYKKGMLEFFTHCKEASGLDNLKVAAQKGHVEASYVYGVILYLTSSKQEGLEFLKRCEAKLGGQMVECRRRVKEFVGEIWINNKIFLPENDSSDQKSCSCVIKKNKVRNNGWDCIDEDDSYGEGTCEACKWNGEVLRFCNMLRTGNYN